MGTEKEWKLSVDLVGQLSGNWLIEILSRKDEKKKTATYLLNSLKKQHSVEKYLAAFLVGNTLKFQGLGGRHYEKKNESIFIPAFRALSVAFISNYLSLVSE